MRGLDCTADNLESFNPLEPVHPAKKIVTGIAPDVLRIDLVDEVVSLDRDVADAASPSLARREGVLAGITAGVRRSTPRPLWLGGSGTPTSSRSWPCPTPASALSTDRVDPQSSA